MPFWLIGQISLTIVYGYGPYTHCLGIWTHVIGVMDIIQYTVRVGRKERQSLRCTFQAADLYQLHECVFTRRSQGGRRSSVQFTAGSTGWKELSQLSDADRLARLARLAANSLLQLLQGPFDFRAAYNTDKSFDDY